MRKIINSMNENLKWIIVTLVSILLTLLGAWAKDIQTEVKSHASQISEIKQENAKVQTKLDLLLSAHGIEFVDEKNLVLKGEKQPK